MLRNYLKQTFRNLIKNKWFTLINILGLTIGISGGIVIYLYVFHELTFDDFHSKADRTYRVVRQSESNSGMEFSASVPYPMGNALASDYPELEAVTQIYGPTDFQIQYKDDKWDEQGVLFADSSFFEVFDFIVISGNINTALKRPNQGLVTESFAEDHFGDENPIGRVVRLSNLEDIEVVGILENPPVNSHLQFSVIVSFETLNKDFIGGFEIKNWNTSIGIMNYIILSDQVNAIEFEHKLEGLTAKYYDKEEAGKRKYKAQPLEEIHFDKNYASSNTGYTINISFIWVIGSVGIFIIVIACINFINLSTALAIKKSKEVGVRKVLGAQRGQLIVQHLGEAYLMTVFSALISLGIVERVLPFVNNFLDVSLELTLLSDASFLVFLFIVIFLVGLLSGLYPALVLSSYSPQQALKSKITDGKGSSLLLRKGLVTFQFVISQVLIISTIVIASQMSYFQSKPLGFDKEHIIKVSLSDNDENKLATFKNEILSNSNVKSVSFAVGVPTSENSIGTNFKMKGQEEDMDARFKAVDFDYQKTFGLTLAAGKWFTSEHQEGSSHELIINETTARKLGYSDPDEVLGESLMIGLNDITAPIVGVVKDFHMNSLHESIEPMFMIQAPRLFFEAGIKINAEDVPATLTFLEDKWNSTFPDYMFDYEFLDESLERNYAVEQSIFGLLQAMAGIAIFIGCLGLIGLVSFLVAQKSKEIGVRKVLGASVFGIFSLFSKGYLKLILLAFLVAAPVSWWVMGEWLATFAYRIELSPLFLISGVIINCLIALVAVGYQSLKAALANPIDALRDE